MMKVIYPEKVTVKGYQSYGRQVKHPTRQGCPDGHLAIGCCRIGFPQEALLRIRRWLNSGQVQAVETELTKQYQFA
jgi:hypothetical protein